MNATKRPRAKAAHLPEGYKVAWDNGSGHACGLFCKFYETKREAVSAAREWKREMVAMDHNSKDARENYTWEIIPQWPDTTPIMER